MPYHHVKTNVDSASLTSLSLVLAATPLPQGLWVFKHGRLSRVFMRLEMISSSDHSRGVGSKEERGLLERLTCTQLAQARASRALSSDLVE